MKTDFNPKLVQDYRRLHSGTDDQKRHILTIHGNLYESRQAISETLHSALAYSQSHGFDPVQHQRIISNFSNAYMAMNSIGLICMTEMKALVERSGNIADFLFKAVDSLMSQEGKKTKKRK